LLIVTLVFAIAEVFAALGSVHHPIGVTHFPVLGGILCGRNYEGGMLG
jgi:hypothetical protein